MHRLTALLEGPLRLIGSSFGSGERLIAAEIMVRSPVGDQPTPETYGGSDSAARTS